LYILDVINQKEQTQIKEKIIMKKKLITLLALAAIVSGVAFAADQEVSIPEIPGSPATPPVPVSTYSEVAYSLDTSGDSSTVVADAESIEFVYTLEAQNGASAAWISAEGQEVFDADWNVRSGFSVNFRIRATAGTINAVSPVTATVSAGKLTHTVLSSTIVNKDVTISGAAAGSALTLGTATGGVNADYVIPFQTISGHYYGLTANAAADSVGFTITYAGDTQAPAGRYNSTVTVAYSAT